MPLLICPCGQNAAMQAVQRNGVEIDVCTQCRGVWLDRGELEKLLSGLKEAQVEDQAERARFEQERDAFYRDPEAYRRSRPQQQSSYEHGEYGERGEHGEYGKDGRRKRRGFDFFDIFD